MFSGVFTWSNALPFLCQILVSFFLCQWSPNGTIELEYRMQQSALPLSATSIIYHFQDTPIAQDFPDLRYVEIQKLKASLWYRRVASYRWSITIMVSKSSSCHDPLETLKELGFFYILWKDWGGSGYAWGSVETNGLQKNISADLPSPDICLRVSIAA